LFFFILCLLIFLSSCRSTKFIGEDQSLVRKTEVIIEGKKRNVNHLLLADELEKIIKQQKPNKYLFVYRDYFDLKHQDPADTSYVFLPKMRKGIRKYIKNKIADPHQIFDSTQVAESAFEMQKYLRNQKGFYDATVSGSYDISSNKKASSSFDVALGDQFKVDSIFYRSNVPEIQVILDEIESDSDLKPGSPIDVGLFESEKERIFQALQNRGYANFLSSNIKIKGDSSDVEKRVDILFDLNASSTSNTYNKYSIGQINVYTDFFQDRKYPKVPSTVIRGKNYYSQSKNFVVNPRSIDRQIFLKSGDQFNRSKYYSSIKQLSSLSTYKFVKLSPRFDTKSDTIINYDIFLTPHLKRWSFDSGIGTSYSTINTIARRLIGFNVDASLVNRNTFGGSERNESFVETGVEYEILSDETKLLRTNAFNVGVTNVTTVPRQVDYLGVIGLIYSLRDVSNAQKEKYEVATRTNFTVGWNYQDVFEFYQINTFSATIGYTYNPNNNWEISFTPTGFNVLDYNSEIRWDSILNKSPILKNSFKSTVFSGLLFKEISAIYKNPETTNGFSWKVLTNFELSGGEIELANKAYNLIAGRQDTFRLSQNLEFAKFAKLQINWSALKKINSYSALAGRINLGIAKPYSSTQSVPYIRQFYVGGPNSMRAWQSRELGPGGNPVNVDPDERFYQTGDIKMEANIEYRSDLVGILEYALFVDAGNVWTLESDPSRADTKLRNLYDQLAVGWGWGLRLDFTYFILRFDFSYRLKNPYLLKPGTQIETYYQSPVGQGIFGNPTIAINYPF